MAHRPIADHAVPDASHRYGSFVWFEHLSSALPTARKFYDPLFNWHTEQLAPDAGGYPLILREGGQAIGGYRQVHAGTPSEWLAYLSVPDVDAAVREALAAGGRLLEPPRDHGTRGRGAVLLDPTGASIALWRGHAGDPPSVDGPAPVGAWCWNELYTTDMAAAQSFYARIAGLRAEAVPHAGAPYLRLIGPDGVARAGLTASVSRQAGSMWLPYVSVDSIDAFVGRATALGGHVLRGPRAVHAVGRVAIVVDPIGAAIAALERAAA